jgi:alkanesulfonate monooxygenase SsuD/methylene tetrahydromethanopterin reductase-like flavin-dependent oxidoreductase (luciferase family)
MEFYIFLPGQWWDRRKPVEQLYSEMMEQALLAEELGYDGIWLAEQNLVSFLAAPDPVQIAAMIAQRTSNIRIGVAVFVAAFHHPLRLAGQISQLDQLSGGRFTVAMGRGASPYQMRQFQTEMSLEDSRAFFQEHLGIMLRHWNDPRSMSFEGRFFQYPNASVLPPTRQKPHPPVYVAALSPGSMHWAVEMGLETNFIFSPFREPFSHVEAVYGAFEESLSKIGRPRSEVKFAVNRMTYVQETEQDAEATGKYVLANHRIIDMQLDDVERVLEGDYVVDQKIRTDEPEIQEMFDNITFGDAETVRHKLRRYADLGVDLYSAWHNIGQSHTQVMRSMRVFAEEIMPEFQAVGARA